MAVNFLLLWPNTWQIATEVMRGLFWLMMWGCILERKHQEMYDIRRCCSYKSTRWNTASLLRRLERREGTGSGLGSKISMSPHLRPATHFLKLVFTSQRFPKCCNNIATQEKWHSNIWVCGRTMLVCFNCVLCLQVLSWVFVYLCLFFPPGVQLKIRDLLHQPSHF